MTLPPRAAADPGTWVPTGVAVPRALRDLAEEMDERLAGRPDLARVFRATFLDTWTRACQRAADGSVFVITGDIPAMWLRDATASIRPYLVLAGRDEQVAALAAGVLRRQVAYVLHDPYANAFNALPDGGGWRDDDTAMSPLVWERKYEVDSLCWPLWLAWTLWVATGDAGHLDAPFTQAARRIVDLWARERDHERQSPYRFRRPGSPGESLARGGLGAPTGPTGLTWSGFRPSDDRCTYGYHVPSNAFAAVVLDRLAEMADGALADAGLAADARALGAGLRAGIAAHATVTDEELGAVLAYEVDGLGGVLRCDDANAPNLLGLPYFGFCAADEPVYAATRRFVLSPRNPYWYTGSAASGIGSAHNDQAGHVWPFGLCLQGLSSTDAGERAALLDVLVATTGGSDLMHESFAADDPARFFRPWFTWANSLFAEYVLDCAGIRVPGSTLRGPAFL